MAYVAYATPCDGFGSIYDVTYADDAVLDTDVRWGYLQHLARRGYLVRVAASAVDAGGILLPSTAIYLPHVSG